jgi:signal recognition particle GTPase
MDVMTEKELDNPELITGTVKTRISMKSGRTPEEVHKLIFMFKQSKVIADWLQLK